MDKLKKYEMSWTFSKDKEQEMHTNIGREI
jgi:hypothetical protein